MGLWAKDFCTDIDDEHVFFNEICQRVIQNPRFYLDLIDNNQEARCLQSYKFSFINYAKTKREKEENKNAYKLLITH